jgi:hypothetical protein
MEWGGSKMLRFMGFMARQTEVVDIVELTPNEVVAKINSATDQITRDDAVDATTISGWDSVIYEIRDEWKLKPDKQRGVIFSEPLSGHHVVCAINRRPTGDYEFIYEDDPVT